MNKCEALNLFTNYLYEKYRTRKAYANDNNVPVSFLSEVLNGKKGLTKTMLKQVGLVKKVERVVTYEQA